MLISGPALLGCGKASTHAQSGCLPHPEETGGLKSAKSARAPPCPFDLINASVQAACPWLSISIQTFTEKLLCARCCVIYF